MQHWLEPITLAYLDPGTGSYALQLLMAGLFGGMFALRHSWGEFKARFSTRFGASRDDPGSSTARRGIGGRPSVVDKVRHHARTSKQPG